MHKYERGEKRSRMTHRLRGLQPAGSATGSRVPPVRIFSKPLAGQPTNCSPRWWRVLGRRRRAISARLSEDQILDQATFLRGAIQRETCWRFLGSTLMRKGRHSPFSAGLLGWERDGGGCRTTTPTGRSRVGAWGNRLQISPFSPNQSPGRRPTEFLKRVNYSQAKGRHKLTPLKMNPTRSFSGPLLKKNISIFNGVRGAEKGKKGGKWREGERDAIKVISKFADLCIWKY